MIERKFINQNIKEFEIKEYIKKNLNRVGLSDVKLQRTPLGEKIVISTSRPGLVVGRSGANITKLTSNLKKDFKLENPQVEIEEIKEIGLDANIISEMIANSLEKYGTSRFKGIGHKAMADVMNAGALGVEILISGKVPSARGKTWRFYQGYLKKCGDIAVSQVKVSYTTAQLKSGTLGIKVSIMTPDTELPDKINIKEMGEPETEFSEVEDKEIQKEMEQKTREIQEAKEKAKKSKQEEKPEPEEKEAEESKESEAKAKKEPEEKDREKQDKNSESKKGKQDKPANKEGGNKDKK